MNNKIVMHTHWDREWYFTKEETQVLLGHHMEEVFKFLENNPKVKYMLDGQTVMIDDFLEINPNLKDRLTKFIASGQLQVGPWYTQTDLMIVSGESIIRNLQVGINQSLEYTPNPMLVGYAPDTFGHNSQMPQIYSSFGINSTVFWRGFSELKAKKSDFMWKGIDGKEIVGVNLATGYQGAKYLETSKEDLKKRMDKILKVLTKYSASKTNLIMNGHDQMPIQLSINKVTNLLEDIYPSDTFEISTLESYVKSLEGIKLENVEGELIHSKHARIHKTINSTRMDIKNLNAILENKLFNILEPLYVKASAYDISYPHGLILKVLKIMFGCHAHDSIGGCNSDKVNQDIKQRLLQANELVDMAINLALRKLSLVIGNEESNKIIIYNNYPYSKKNETVEVELLTLKKDFKIFLDDIELEYVIQKQEQIMAGSIDRQIAARQKDYPMYKTFLSIHIHEIAADCNMILTVKELEEDKEKLLNDKEKVFADISSSGGKIIVNKDGIDFVNKEVIYNNFIKLEAMRDSGDSYDYSPPHDISDEIKELVDFKYTLLDQKETSNQILYKIRVVDKANIIKSTFDLELIYNKILGEINIKLETVNKDKNTKFRLVFDSQENYSEVLVGMQLSTLKRKIKNKKELEIWESDKWAEKPVSIETMQDFVATDNIAIISPLCKEYEVLEEESNKLAFTMYRTFDKLGKSDLVNRPGRPSGIEIDTPDNQLENIKLNFNFLVSFNCTNPAKRAYELKQKLLAYKVEKVNSLNINNTLKKVKVESLNLNLDQCVISAYKLTKENEKFIRIFNPTDKIQKVEAPANVYIASMLEKKEEMVKEVDLKPQEIVNIIIQN